MKPITINTQTDCQLSVGLSLPDDENKSNVVLIMEEEDMSSDESKMKETVAILSLNNVRELINYLKILKHTLEQEELFNIKSSVFFDKIHTKID